MRGRFDGEHELKEVNMKAILGLVVVAFAVFSVLSPWQRTLAVQDVSVRDSVAWWGTYAGVIPIDAGRDTRLTINRDYTFELTTEQLNWTGVDSRGNSFMTMANFPQVTVTGNFHWDSSGRVITLEIDRCRFTLERTFECYPMFFQCKGRFSTPA